jgi:hypothetical protein
MVVVMDMDMVHDGGVLVEHMVHMVVGAVDGMEVLSSLDCGISLLMAIRLLGNERIGLGQWGGGGIGAWAGGGGHH